MTSMIVVVVVYDDELNGFDDWSWSKTYSLTQTTTKQSGSRAISFTPKNWEAVYFYYPTTGDMADYQSISFWIHGNNNAPSPNFGIIDCGCSMSLLPCLPSWWYPMVWSEQVVQKVVKAFVLQWYQMVMLC
jgi:hypothetical protein